MRSMFFLTGTLATVASAANTAFVANNCTFPVFLSTAGGNSPATSQTLAAGGNFSQPISGSGAALMVSQTQGGADNELDYSLTSSLFYALGGNQGFSAFQDYGLSIVPSDPTCASVVCPAGDGEQVHPTATDQSRG
ncbi:MAG: hypothetical protein Q9159_007088 [Coniocarpon cinnabarinum]